MGAGYTAYAAIGVKVDKDKLIIKSLVRECEHALPKMPSRAKFCPECGKPLWTEDERLAGFVETEYPGEIDLYGCKIVGYELAHSTNDEDIVIGLVCKTNHVGLALLPDDLTVLKSSLRVKLEPIGLWNEYQFGLWAVLHCSY